MGMWQDNSLQRITQLEEQVQAHAHLLHDISELLVAMSWLLEHHAGKENSSYESRGTERL